MSKAPKTAPAKTAPKNDNESSDLNRYEVRIVEANKTIKFFSKAKTMTELRNAIYSPDGPVCVIFNTEDYGPAMIHRDHIILITRGTEAS